MTVTGAIQPSGNSFGLASVGHKGRGKGERGGESRDDVKNRGKYAVFNHY